MTTGRCEFCRNITVCGECGSKVNEFRHVGVRASGPEAGGIWHIALPCGHRNTVEQVTVPQGGQLAKYNGGPLWQDGYQWVNIFWGPDWEGNPWVDQLDTAVQDIEKNASYSGGLSQYNVGTGSLHSHVVINSRPPSTLAEKDIGAQLGKWVSEGTIPDLKGKGAYNIFLQKGVTATLGNSKSCVQFCDYHDTAGGTSGPFFTLEPYPCSAGCNQCNSNPLDTLTMGLSEEMTELKTDMDPGTGWVIGNEEICDYCDKHFVCNQISTGQYVNAWYSNKAGACWKP